MKKAINNLKIWSATFSPPNFVVPVSRQDKDSLVIILSTKYLFQFFFASFELTKLFQSPGS